MLLTIRQQKVIKRIAYIIEMLLIVTIIGLGCNISRKNIIIKENKQQIKALTEQVDSLTMVNDSLLVIEEELLNLQDTLTTNKPIQ